MAYILAFFGVPILHEIVKYIMLHNHINNYSAAFKMVQYYVPMLIPALLGVLTVVIYKSHIRQIRKIKQEVDNKQNSVQSLETNISALKDEKNKLKEENRKLKQKNEQLQEELEDLKSEKNPTGVDL